MPDAAPDGARERIVSLCGDESDRWVRRRARRDLLMPESERQSGTGAAHRQPRVAPDDQALRLAVGRDFAR
jgi:hypothetical protein